MFVLPSSVLKAAVPLVIVLLTTVLQASAAPEPNVLAYLRNNTREPAGTPIRPVPVTPFPNSTDRSSFIDGIASDIYYATREARGLCVYGYNCGSKCGWSPYTGSVRYAYGGSRPKSIDNLDSACVAHDSCLKNERWDPARTQCAGPGMQGMICHCERNLASTARGIYNREKKCSWWQIWCIESNKVAAALAIAQAMDQRKYCGSC